MVSDWLDLLAQRPNRVPAKLADLPLKELVETFHGKESVPRLSGTTLGKHVGSLANIWRRGVRRGYIDDNQSNPFENHGIRKNLPPTEGQEGLTISEINAIFRLPIFTKGERPIRGKGEASYWIPLLLLWTGARPNEIAQLLVSDFWRDQATDQWMMIITDNGDHPIKGPRKLKMDL